MQYIFKTIIDMKFLPLDCTARCNYLFILLIIPNAGIIFFKIKYPLKFNPKKSSVFIRFYISLSHRM